MDLTDRQGAAMSSLEISEGTLAPDPVRLAAAIERRISMDRDDPYGMPGAVLAASGPGGGTTVVARGVDRRGVPLNAGSLFPLASASKLATGLLILLLIESGQLDLEASLGDVLPDARAANTPGVTIRRLLSHASGLPLEVSHDLSEEPGSVRYGAGLTWPGSLADACLNAEPVTAPGARVQYSNIAYGLLGLAAERAIGEPFRVSLARMVFGPLGIEAYIGDLPDRDPIAVGDVPSPYSASELEPYNSKTWRAVGAPWSGVTTTAAGLLTLVRAYADDSPILRPETARLARTDQTAGAPGGFGTTDAFLGHKASNVAVWDPCPWGLAVEVQGARAPHWAPATLPRSIGQIGSSGCLAWYDPDSGIAWALLGTRTTESGWLLRFGSRIAQAALASLETR